MECDHGDQPVLRLPHNPCGRTRHEEARLEPYHHGLRAFAGRFSLQVGLRRAKHGIAGLTKTVALELARSKITCNCISPGCVWTPLVEKQIPNTMKARNTRKDQVISDVLLAAQSTKEFVTVEQVASLALFLCSDAARSPAPTSRSTAAGRPVGPPKCALALEMHGERRTATIEQEETTMPNTYNCCCFTEHQPIPLERRS